MEARSYTVRDFVQPGWSPLNPASGEQFVPAPAGITDIATGIDFLNADDCLPTPDGTACKPDGCPQPDGLCEPSVILSSSTCDIDGGPCNSDDDCPCGGVCVHTTRIADCACNIQLPCILAGDKDDFAFDMDPDDVIVMRPEFEDWVNRPGGNNDTYHNGQSLPFDRIDDVDNWEFGYSFENLPTMSSATLMIHLRGGPTLPTTDSLSLQFSDNPPNMDLGRCNLDGARLGASCSA